MLPVPPDRDNTRLPLNSAHSSTSWLSKYGSPSHVLQKPDTYHTENPSYFRDKQLFALRTRLNPNTESVSAKLRVIEC